MKYFLSIVLVLSFLTQNISKLIIVINFEINREFIAKTRCVNKDKPDSCCKGKCELKKQLDEDEKKQNLPANTFKDKFEKQNYYPPVLSVLAAGGSAIKPEFVYLCDKGVNAAEEIFHPPSFLS